MQLDEFENWTEKFEDFGVCFVVLMNGLDESSSSKLL